MNPRRRPFTRSKTITQMMTISSRFINHFYQSPKHAVKRYMSSDYGEHSMVCFNPFMFHPLPRIKCGAGSALPLEGEVYPPMAAPEATRVYPPMAAPEATRVYPPLAAPEATRG
jgi:hypothetical protein